MARPVRVWLGAAGTAGQAWQGSARRGWARLGAAGMARPVKARRGLARSGRSGMNLRENLQNIYNERGTLTAPLVVAEASNPNHPLHERFEWDNTVAGKRYREVQARELIRSVKITYRDHDGNDSDVRAFQCVRRDDQRTYIPTEDIAADPILTQIVLMDMSREWKALKARWGQHAEFFQLIRDDIPQAG